MERFAELARDRKLVSIRRANIDANSIQGFILGFSERLVLIQYVYDFKLDGRPGRAHERNEQLLRPGPGGGALRPRSLARTAVGVFRREGESEVQVGEYERNYPSLLRTFAHFRADGRAIDPLE